MVAALVFTLCVAGAGYVAVQGDMLSAVWLMLLAFLFGFAALTGADGY